MVQIGRYSGAPVVHTVELLDWATGGPIPQALKGRTLREPPPLMPTIPIHAVTTPPDNPGFW